MMWPRGGRQRCDLEKGGKMVELVLLVGIICCGYCRKNKCFKSSS